MILAFETAAYRGASLALLEGDTCLCQIAFDTPRTLTSALVPAVQRLLAEARITPAALSLLAVDCGPGSFTGMRIGVAVVNGLADAWGTPTCGIAQFDVWPQPAAQDQAQLLMLDAQASHGAHYQLTLPDGTCMRGFTSYAALPDVLRAAGDLRGVICSDRPLDGCDTQGWRVVQAPAPAGAEHVGRVAAAAVAAGRRGAVAPLYLHAMQYARVPAPAC